MVLMGDAWGGGRARVLMGDGAPKLVLMGDGGALEHLDG